MRIQHIAIVLLLITTLGCQSTYTSSQQFLIQDIPEGFELIRNFTEQANQSNEYVQRTSRIHQKDIWGVEDKLILEEIELYENTADAMRKYSEEIQQLQTLNDSQEVQVQTPWSQDYAQLVQRSAQTQDIWVYGQQANAVLLFKYVKTEPNGAVNNTVVEAQEILRQHTAQESNKQ